MRYYLLVEFTSYYSADEFQQAVCEYVRKKQAKKVNDRSAKEQHRRRILVVVRPGRVWLVLVLQSIPFPYDAWELIVVAWLK